MLSTINKNIVLVGPGTLPIPVPGLNGWGGIENTLTWIIEEFEKRNQEYTLINDSTNYKEKVDNVCNTKDSIVHVHYDHYAINLNSNKNYPLISTSHNPYHPFIETWDSDVFDDYTRLFNNIDGYFGQSECSNINALNINPNLKTGICRCGIPNYLFEPFRKDKGNKRSLVIGKIESRKNQFLLQNVFSNDLDIDFVGPNSDPDFIAGDVGKTKYLGIWSRQDVVKKMSDYSSLILLSRVEGDVLVVKEALAAGCSVILSEKAALNMDAHPFIQICDDNISKLEFINHVIRINEENEKYRSDIISYFNKKFEISVTVSQYINSFKKLYA
jgi:hypothetical protein